MKENVADDLGRLTVRPMNATTGQAQKFDSDGVGRRIDPAHNSGGHSGQSENLSRDHQLDTHFLHEVSQIAHRLHLQIQSQKDELDVREKTFQELKSAFENERLRSVQSVASERSLLEALTIRLETNEKAFAERCAAFELQSRTFDAERVQFSREREELELRKQSFRHEVIEELKAERESIDRAKTSFSVEQERVRLLEATLQKRLSELAVENDRTLQSEREKLWHALTTEWEQRHVAFQQDQQAWQKLRDSEKAELDREKAFFESTVTSANAEFVTTREALAIELTGLREQHKQQLQAEQSEWKQTRELEQAELRAAREEWERELQSSRGAHELALQSERDAWKTTHQREEAESIAARESLDRQLIAQREQEAEVLLAERREWEQNRTREKEALSAVQSELARERTLIESRIRFQQDHLDKSRYEFEQLQNEHRRERQVEQQRLEEAGMQIIRRLRQVDQYRSSIDEREKSLDREHDVFHQMRKAVTNTVELDRLNIQAERQAWDQEREYQQAELRRQQEAVAERSESLESRRARLDKLRVELEETHRATLEMRLAVEEAWAQITRVTDQDDARQRVEQAHKALIDNYQQMQETLIEQRRELTDALAKFERQRTEFAEERQKLTQWFAARDEELRVGEERLRVSAAESSSQHTNWLAARDRWLIERTEAEQLIRRLLSSLGENNREQSRDLEALLP
jgi:hypothetical protein